MACVFAAGVFLAATGSLAFASAPVETTIPETVVPVTDGPIDEQSGVTVPPSVPVNTAPSVTTTVPVGCAPPPVSQAVFVGRLKTLDVTAGVFEVVRLRSGSLAGYSTETTTAVGGTVTEVGIYFGRDVKFLKVGKSYLVGASLDAATGRIFSRVTESSPMFGGNQVADINNSGVVCPTYVDPARTLNVDGSSIESGVLSGLNGDSNRILLAIVVPAVLVLLGLVTAVLLRRTLTA